MHDNFSLNVRGCCFFETKGWEHAMEQVDLQDFEDMFCDDSERSKQAKEAFIRAVNDVPGGVAMLVFGTEFLLFAVSSVVVKGAILEKLNGGTQ